jgi:tRNA threonylcarbamoyladenosine biosynthesis protein TsaE
MSRSITTRSADETRQAGATLGATLRPGDLVILVGDLGAGKTTFVKGVAEALGVSEPVTSPTFTIVQEYEGRVPLAHVDVYRLERVQELHDLGFDELLEGRVVVVEWGDTVEAALPPDLLEVRITADGDDVRVIELATRGRAWATRTPQLAATGRA